MAKHDSDSISSALTKARANGAHPLGTLRMDGKTRTVRVRYKDRLYSVTAYDVLIVDGFSTIEDTSLIYEGTKAKVSNFLLSCDLDSKLPHIG